MYLITLLGREHETGDRRGCKELIPTRWLTMHKWQESTMSSWSSEEPRKEGYESDERFLLWEGSKEDNLEDQLFLEHYGAIHLTYNISLNSPHKLTVNLMNLLCRLRN